MRKAMIRSLPLPEALVNGSTATRMVLQSCSSSRRKSSGDHGCLKAARSITITSSRSSGVMRRTSSLARARTATSAALLRRRGAAGVLERIEDAHGGPLAQAGQQFLQEPLVFLPAHPLAQRLALGRGQLAAAQRFVELAVAQLGGQLEPVVEIAPHPQLAREDGADLVLGQLDRAGERFVVCFRGESAAQARDQRRHLAALEVEELEPLD